MSRRPRGYSTSSIADAGCVHAVASLCHRGGIRSRGSGVVMNQGSGETTVELPLSQAPHQLKLELAVTKPVILLMRRSSS